MTKSEIDDYNVKCLSAYMDSRGIPVADRDVLPLGDDGANLRGFTAISFPVDKHPVPKRVKIICKKHTDLTEKIMYGVFWNPESNLLAVSSRENHGGIGEAYFGPNQFEIIEP